MIYKRSKCHFDDKLTAKIRSIDFHESGTLCVTSNEAGVCFFDTIDNGDNIASINDMVDISGLPYSSSSSNSSLDSSKIPCPLSNIVKFTHSKHAVLMAPSQISHGDKNSTAIHLVAVREGESSGVLLRRFYGHSSRVTSISQNPANDTFLSSDDDGIIKIWDIRSPHAELQGSMPNKGKTIVTYDPEGVTFAVSDAGGSSVLDRKIRIFDGRNPKDGVILEINVPKNTSAIEDIKFSPDNMMLTITSASNVSYFMNSLQSSTIHFQVNCDKATPPVFSPNVDYCATYESLRGIVIYKLNRFSTSSSFDNDSFTQTEIGNIKLPTSSCTSLAWSPISDDLILCGLTGGLVMYMPSSS